MPGFCAVMLAKAERIAAGSFSRFLWVICVLSLYHEKNTPIKAINTNTVIRYSVLREEDKEFACPAETTVGTEPNINKATAKTAVGLFFRMVRILFWIKVMTRLR